MNGYSTLLNNIAPGKYIVIKVEYGLQLHIKIFVNKSDRKNNNKNILKRKSFATLSKLLFPSFDTNILLRDIVINKSNDLPSKQHENQNSETYSC